MKTTGSTALARPDRQRANWLIDAALYAGFVASMLLDLTGLTIHEWLGAAVIVACGYHLLVHRQWVATVTRRFLKLPSGQARRFYVIDALLLIGMLGIGVTGLAISTWLDLPLADYLLWRDLHVYGSVGVLGAIVLKLAIHWRWILTVGRRTLHPGGTPPARLAAVPATAAASRLGRREFTRLMLAVGGTAAYASWSALVPATEIEVEASGQPGLAAAQPSTATPAATATATPTAAAAAGQQISGQGARRRGGRTAAESASAASSVSPATTSASAAATATPTTAAPTASATSSTVTATPTTAAPAASATSSTATAPAAAQAPSAGQATPATTPGATTTTAQTTASQCTVRCPKGCSYPGQCRRYVDANNNRKCDLGECL